MENEKHFKQTEWISYRYIPFYKRGFIFSDEKGGGGDWKQKDRQEFETETCSEFSGIFTSNHDIW